MIALVSPAGVTVSVHPDYLSAVTARLRVCLGFGLGVSVVGVGCGRVADRGGDRVTEKRCGGPVYAVGNSVCAGRIGNESGPGLMREHQGNPRPNHYRGVANDR